MKNKDNPAAVLASYEAIFESSDMRVSDGKEKVIEIPLADLHPFEKHPFKVLDDGSMNDTAESVKQFGVLIPGVVRPREAGGYEIISGHRRKHACEIAGLNTMPVIIRNLDDDEAVIVLVDSNLQREEILPSEKALAYKIKMEALKRRAGRRTKNPAQVERNFQGKESRDILAEQVGESRAQIQRYIRLTELLPELLSKVDDKQIAFNPAVELSYLRHEEQQTLLEVIALIEATPSLSQAQKLKKISQRDGLTFEAIESILSEVKKDTDRIVIKGEQLKKFFPKAYTPRQIEDIIINTTA
jgi:ParB family chromosome partitioning protein